MTSTRSVATVAASLAIVLAGCSTSAGTSATKRDTSTTVASSTIAPAPTTTATSSSDSSDVPPVSETPQSRALAEKLVQTIPGYVLQPDSVGDTGPSNLDKAVHDDGGANVRKELTDDHFIVGYQKLFTTPKKDRLVIVFAYQFADAAGATEYMNASTKHEQMPQDGVVPTRFAVPGIPGATGIQATHDGTTFHEVFFTKGNVVAEVQTNDENGDAAKPSAVEVATQEYPRL